METGRFRGEMVCLRIRGWRRVGLGMKMGVFKDQGWRRVGLG